MMLIFSTSLFCFFFENAGHIFSFFMPINKLNW